MKINKLNYENYVIDYIEGTLSIDLKKDFDLFLEKNKDVYDEIKEYMSAPIYEETEEVFDNKKAVLQSNNLGKIALLALIPILALGVYFISSNKTEQQNNIKETTENLAVETQTELEETKQIESREQIATTKTESKQIAKETPAVEKKKKVEKNEVQKKTIEQKIRKQTKKIAEPTIPVVQFAEAVPQAKQIENREIETEAIASRVLISTPISLGNLDLRFETPGAKITNEKMAFAEVISQEPNTLEKKKLAWLEMITPESFEDIDLRESLAIETNTQINSRKILNAFIPESLVK